MYADRHLARLADRKSLLRARISVRRLECVLAVEQLAPPLRLVDHIMAGWRRLSPWVKAIGVPLGFFAVSKFAKSTGEGTSKGKWAALLGALPMVVEAWKGFREVRQGPGARADA